MKREKNVLKIMAVLPVIFFLFSCDINDTEESSAVLLLSKITGQTYTGDDADFLQSDVVTDLGTVYADIVTATLEAKLKEPETLGPGTSYQSSIFVYRYRVTYTAVDPSGATVPQSFEGSLSALLDVDSSMDISFVIVREVAKANPPLDALATGGILQVVATVTFYGRDGGGNELEATGYLTIYFADYIDI